MLSAAHFLFAVLFVAANSLALVCQMECGIAPPMPEKASVSVTCQHHHASLTAADTRELLANQDGCGDHAVLDNLFVANLERLSLAPGIPAILRQMLRDVIPTSVKPLFASGLLSQPLFPLSSVALRV